MPTTTPFLSYLTEARMFYNATDLKGRSAKDIAELVYLMFMMLEILRHQDPKEAKDYADRTLVYHSYERMYFSGTDLGNLLAVLNNQKDFEDKIDTDTAINIPLFQINRYLRDVRAGADSKNDDALFFYRCEEYLRMQSNAMMRQLRRDILDWANKSKTERTRLDQILRKEFNARAATVDMYLHYKQIRDHKLLGEDKEPHVDVSKVATYHQELNQKLWDGDVLRPEVKTGLRRIAKKFLEFLEVDQFKVDDIIITGSNAAFNYTDDSDVDLHVVLDAEGLEDNPMVEPFLSAKKRLWNSGHDITAKGHDVEIYPELLNQKDKLVATGVYSLLKDEWVKKPTYQKIQIDDDAVQAKAIDMMQRIDDLVDSHENKQEEFDAIWDRIVKMRREGLDTIGEFSAGNLAFKVLRNHGYLDKLAEWQTHIGDSDLTIEDHEE